MAIPALLQILMKPPDMEVAFRQKSKHTMIACFFFTAENVHPVRSSAAFTVPYESFCLFYAMSNQRKIFP